MIIISTNRGNFDFVSIDDALEFGGIKIDQQFNVY